MMRIFLRIAILAGLVSASLAAAANRFLHTDGKYIVAPDGKKLLLRGINLGNWLVPEGYMFHFDKGPASYREISALFNDLIGPDEAARFWRQYRETYITEADIRFIHEAGFNSVRIPFHSKLIDDGTAFPLLDRVIAWCRQAHIWVILDMHCAPGGQTGTNIDDSWGNPPFVVHHITHGGRAGGNRHSRPRSFFSSRRRHTRYIGDWSSDVCSSD